MIFIIGSRYINCFEYVVKYSIVKSDLTLEWKLVQKMYESDFEEDESDLKVELFISSKSYKWLDYCYYYCFLLPLLSLTVISLLLEKSL